MTTETFKYAGTVSHGTLQVRDLVPKFLEVLSDLDPATAKAIESSYEDDIKAAIHGERDPEPEGVGDLLDVLFNALDSFAPEGWYFGAIEGDGSDFGFWEHDNE